MEVASWSIFAVLLFMSIWTFLFGFWDRAIMRTSAARAFVTSFVLTFIGIAWSILASFSVAPHRAQSADPFNAPQGDTIVVFAVCTILNLGVAVIVKVYGALVLDNASEKERQPGIAGVRAWLSIPSALAVPAIAVAAAILGYSFIGAAIVALCVLLIYPAVCVAGEVQPTTTMPPAPAAERQRVLALVESGKITAEEAAELLTALAQSQSSGGDAPPSLTGPRRVMAVGAAVMLVGFFLPWFGENLSKAMDNMQQAMGGQWSAPDATQIRITSDHFPAPGTSLQNIVEVTLRGGDVRDGLGWIALGAAIAGAAMPLFWPARGRDDRLVRNLTLAVLVVGSVALLYLLSNAFNAITTIEPGFLLAMGGYVVLWIGAVREYMPPRVQLQPASAAI